MKNTFKALWIEETTQGFSRRFVERKIEDLPAGEVTIRVRYSSLNYKDALSASGNRGVTRNYPHTPGIDAAGEVLSCEDRSFTPGDKVIVTGYDLGMNTSGGLGEVIRVPSPWVMALPEGLGLREAMIYGTAGLTAALSVDSLSRDVSPSAGEILVTGASGGVGSVAVALLTKLGYAVTAVTGKPEAQALLKGLGAKAFLTRREASEGAAKPILKGRWAGVIDTVGGEILSAAVKSALPLATVTCCGNVASPELSMTVFPFILRGVRLVGIDSQNCPRPTRERLWSLLGDEWQLPSLEALVTEIPLESVGEKLDAMLEGGSKGRVVVNLG